MERLDIISIYSIGALVIGIITSVIGAWLWSWLAPRLPLIVKPQSPSISGWWVGKLTPAYDVGREVLNLIRLRESNGKVRIYIEHYNNRKFSPSKYRGIGIYLPPSLSAIYYESGFQSNQTGVWSLRLRHDAVDRPILEGVYAHVIDREGVEGALARSEHYRLDRVELPMMFQLKVLIGRYCFVDYQAARMFFQNRFDFAGQ